MANITCEVAKDLLPLYADDVLSEESKALVEEHVKGCSDCADYLRKLKSNDMVTPERNEKGKKAIKKIKNKILVKRIATAVISAICAVAVAFGIFYGVAIKQSYVPYEESGLTISGDYLETDKIYYASYGFYTFDGSTLFMYLTTTAYDKSKQSDEVRIIDDLSEEGRKFVITEEDGEVTTYYNTEIYYVPENIAKRLEKGDRKWIDEEAEQIKETSVLVWKAE